MSVNDNFSSTQLHDPYGVGKLSISRAKTCNFSSVGYEKKILRLSIGQFERKIFLARDGTFFSFLFCRTFLELRTFNMHLQYLCAVYYNRAYQQGKNLSAAVSLIHGTPEHARTTLEPTGYRSIAEIDDPQKICPNR